MPTIRLSMRKLRGTLRLRLQAELSLRQIKGSLRVSLGAIQKVASRAHELELDWAAIDVLDDQQLAKLIYPASDLRLITPKSSRRNQDKHSADLKPKGKRVHLIYKYQCPKCAEQR
jgi:hypothetical protein